jgi:acylphosphatase
MSNELVKAEILVNGLVQGVGFRYFVYHEAQKLNLNGYVKNLYSGEVITVVEGEKFVVEDFFQKLKVGPMHAHVKNASVKWAEYKNEFSTFEIRH